MAGPRRRSREIALQILVEMDVSPELSPQAALTLYFSHFQDEEGAGALDEGRVPTKIDQAHVEQLVRGFAQHRKEIDEAITGVSRNWRLERMAQVDRNVLRLAMYELRHGEGVPVSVVINEAVELAKRFGTVEGGAFVNGILDRAVTELNLRR